jgi:hypothetical protein
MKPLVMLQVVLDFGESAFRLKIKMPFFASNQSNVNGCCNNAYAFEPRQPTVRPNDHFLCSTFFQIKLKRPQVQ